MIPVPSGFRRVCFACHEGYEILVAVKQDDRTAFHCWIAASPGDLEFTYKPQSTETMAETLQNIAAYASAQVVVMTQLAASEMLTKLVDHVTVH